jgi:hypothetical protein
MMFLLHKLQARLRGLITRNKVKSAAKVRRNFSGRDNYGNYHFIQHSLIVIINFNE